MAYGNGFRQFNRAMSIAMSEFGTLVQADQPLSIEYSHGGLQNAFIMATIFIGIKNVTGFLSTGNKQIQGSVMIACGAPSTPLHMQYEPSKQSQLVYSAYLNHSSDYNVYACTHCNNGSIMFHACSHTNAMMW